MHCVPEWEFLSSGVKIRARGGLNSSDVCDLKEQLKGRKDGSVLEDHLSEDWEEHQERIYEWRGVVDHIEIDSADYNEMECVGRMITYRMRTLLDYD